MYSRILYNQHGYLVSKSVHGKTKNVPRACLVSHAVAAHEGLNASRGHAALGGEASLAMPFSAFLCLSPPLNPKPYKPLTPLACSLALCLSFYLSFLTFLLCSPTF